MLHSTPYVQRRGHSLNFRIAIPADLHVILGGWEITKTLRTSDRSVAFPTALEYAARVKRAFAEVRAAMATLDQEKLMQVLRLAKVKLELSDRTEQHQDEMLNQRRDHLREIERVRLETEIKVLRDAMAAGTVRGHFLPPGPRPSAPHGVISTSSSKTSLLAAPEVITLQTVVDDYLTSYPAKKKAAMFKKHSGALPLLVKIVGDKPVMDLKQSDIKLYFDTVQKLPPRWADQCRKLKVSVLQLAEMDHPETLGPKTFKGTYKASLGPFLAAAKNSWQDRGFPATLTIEGNEYQGDREEGSSKQRAFRLDELQRLFEGPEMLSVAVDPSQAHRYWLPLIGLFTGARVNEICQVNPATDIIREAKTGIWYLNIDDKTEGDARINKRTKNAGSRRKIPIHSKLIDLDFLDYFERVKRQGAKLLFPAFAPSRRKASGEAEKWFCQFLRETSIRDETPGARIVGMHAFRSTLLSHALNLSPPVDVRSITGHSNGKGAVVNGYEGEVSVINKKKLLEEISFDLEFHRPAKHLI